jgi:hypothetical protein
MGDLAGHAASGELIEGFLRVVPGIQVNGDLIRERAELTEFVQPGGQQRGAVPVRRAAPGALPAPGGLGDAPRRRPGNAQEERSLSAAPLLNRKIFRQSDSK